MIFAKIFSFLFAALFMSPAHALPPHVDNFHGFESADKTELSSCEPTRNVHIGAARNKIQVGYGLHYSSTCKIYVDPETIEYTLIDESVDRATNVRYLLGAREENGVTYQIRIEDYGMTRPSNRYWFTFVEEGFGTFYSEVR